MSLFLQTLRQIVIPRNSRREKLARFFQRKITWLYSVFSFGYPTWIKLNEPDEKALIAQHKLDATLPLQPLISLFLHINSPTKYLRSEIQSILAQSYPKWELWIIATDQASPDIRQELDSYTRRDERIKLQLVKPEAGLGSQINSRISAAQAEFVAFLDQDLRLAPFALSAIIQALNENPATDFFYADEDHLASDGKNRFDPVFKPAFSIDYLRSYPYIQHFLVIRKSLGDRLGWLRDGFENGWEYDLVLRTVEQARWITHIPQVLVHIRTSSLKQNSAINSRKSRSGMAIIQEHLSRCGLPAKVENGVGPGLIQVKYLSSQAPLISIIIPNHEHTDDLQRCIDSILAQTKYQHYEILIVENNSHGQGIFTLYEQLKIRDSRVRIIDYTQILFNYSQINNFAADKASGEVLLFLNNDTQVLNPDWLERMLEYALRPDVGAVGAKLYFSNGLIQHAGIIIGLGVGAGHHFVGSPRDFPGYQYNLIVPQNLSAVTAACLMIRRDVFFETGGFDEQYQLSYGDIDLCLKIQQKDYLIVWTPFAELIHYESRTRGYEVTTNQETRFNHEASLFMQIWAAFLDSGDPFYNPNLTLSRGDFSIRKEVCNQHPRHSRGLLNKIRE